MFALHAMVFLLIPDSASSELSKRGYSIVPRMGSRSAWWLSRVALLSVVCAAYMTMVCMAVLLGAATTTSLDGSPVVGDSLTKVGFVRAWPEGINAYTLAALIFFLWWGTLLSLTLIQTIINLASRRPVLGLLSVMVGVLMSWQAGTDVAPWLPASHAMVVRHTPFSGESTAFTVQWSLIYNVVCSIAMIITGTVLLRHYDIFENHA